jgi:hypothetical protein
MNSPKPAAWLTAAEAVKEFGFAPLLLRRWQELGRIHPDRRGKFRRADILEMIWCEQNSLPPESETQRRDPSLG